MKLCVVAVGVLCSDLALAAVTPEQKCEGAKNLAAGKYLACRQNAEKGLAQTADATKYGEAIASRTRTAWPWPAR